MAVRLSTKIAPDLMIAFIFRFSLIILLICSRKVSLANLVDGECVDSVEDGVDYFGDKITIDYATLFTVEYFDTYKVVKNSYVGATYYLYQCGTDAPTEVEDGAFVLSVPVTSVAIGDTTYIPRIEQLGERLSLKAFTSDTSYITSPCVNQLIDEGYIVDALTSDDACYSNVVDNAALEDAGIAAVFSTYDTVCAYDYTFSAIYNVVLVSDYVEDESLGITEWIKFFSLFYNREAEATLIFDEIVDRYTCTSENAATCAAVFTAPSVSWTLWYDGFGWATNSEEDYYSEMISLAGGEMILCDTGSVESDYGFKYMTNDELYACIMDADVCIFTSDLADVYGVDEEATATIEKLNCFKNGQVFDNQRNGPYDWFESRIANPDVLLEDLVMALHDDSTSFGIGFHERVWLRKFFDDETSVVSDTCEDTSAATETLAEECVTVVAVECSSAAGVSTWLSAGTLLSLGIISATLSII